MASRFVALLALVAACGGPPPPARPAEPSTQTNSAPAPATDAGAPLPAPAPGPVATGEPQFKETPPDRITARHVLIQYIGAEHAAPHVARSREQALALAQEVLRRAKAKEDFARLAVEYSDEPNAGARGGSVGRFGRGQMVAAFEAAAFKLAVGEISDIVESPFGFHIIQRTE